MLRSGFLMLLGRSPSPLWLRAMVFGVSYLLCAVLGRQLSAPVGTYLLNFWLPAGLFVVVLLRHPVSAWPVLLVTGTVANLVFDLSVGTPVRLALVFCSANAVQATAAAWSVNRFVSHPLTLSTVPQFFGFLLWAGIVATFLGGGVQAAWLGWLELNGTFWAAVRSWWGSCALATLVFSPLVLVWGIRLPAKRSPRRPVKVRRVVEGICLFAALIAHTWFTFVMSEGVTTPFKFQTLPLLVWAGLRFGLRGAASANFIYGLIVVYSAANAQSEPAATIPLATPLVIFTTQAFIGVYTLVSIVPAIVLEEREAAQRREAEARQGFTRELIASQEAERTRIAREIHDHLGQLLTALKLDLRAMERRASVLGDQDLRTALTDKITSARELADETIASVQKIASELRPGLLDRLGVAAAIEVEAQNFATRTHLTVRCDIAPKLPELSQEVAIAIFRIFQEILTNVARHAHANTLEVQLASNAGQLQLCVTDNGIGLDPVVAADSFSLGLLGMRERAELIGAELEFRRPTSGRGTMVRLTLPLCAPPPDLNPTAILPHETYPARG